MKVVIFGSSGMLGQGVLLECLDNPDVEAILLINRSNSNYSHPKVKIIVHDDFFNFQDLIQDFSEYDTCFFCLGVTSVGKDEATYTSITYDITMAAARALLATNKPYTFCYISGAGTDSTEKGRSMWARVKGKTENALLAMPFKKAFMLRPGYIQPKRGIKSKTGWYQAFYVVFKPLYFLLKPIKSFITDSETLARCMIHISQNGYPSQILESTDINIAGKK